MGSGSTTQLPCARWVSRSTSLSPPSTRWRIGALPPLTGSLAAATVIGFLVPLAPNGWGVREGILVFLLAQLMPTSVAVMVSVTSRVWLALAEALWVILLVALARLFRTAAPVVPADRSACARGAIQVGGLS